MPEGLNLIPPTPFSIEKAFFLALIMLLTNILRYTVLTI